MSNTYFYDVESFPNLFTVTFLSEDGTDNQFAIGVEHNDYEELVRFMEQPGLQLVGFNNINYDDPVIRFILQNGHLGMKIPSEVFKLSARLISDESRRDDDILALRYPRGYESWTSMDLLKIMAFDRMGVSLKQIAINLKHSRIQDLPYKYDYRIKNEKEVQVVLDYNRNDTVITKKLFHTIQPQILLRREIGSLYDVDVTNASDSKMGNIILEHFYREAGYDTRQLKDLRTKRTAVSLRECVPSVISFSAKELVELKEAIESEIVFASSGFRFEREVKFDNTNYSIGVGGIHSVDTPVHWKETADTKIVSADIASMYPSCIIINNIYPQHLGEDFVSVLKDLTAERLAAKKSNKTKADALKITINGLYGKLNSDTFWLEDAKAMLRVTIAGQLYILMLIEKLAQVGIHCISANTDGIECLVANEKENLYYDVCKDWETLTGFTLEYTFYKSYIKRDVNNYIAITTDGKVKTKGAFIPDIDLKKGYKHPIIPIAVNKYFINGTPVEKTIQNHRDIFDFCISQKVGGDFRLEHHSLNGVDILQKTNRFYISNSGGALHKRRISNSKSTTGLFVGEYVRLLNDYDPSIKFEDYDVDLEWYIREARKMVEEIEPKIVQGDMFSGVSDFGRKTTLNGIVAPPKSKREKKEKIVTEKDVREAVRTKETFDVSGRYMVVTQTNTTYSPVITMHSLQKGTGGHKIKIKKNVWASNQLKVGDIIYLSDMKEEPAVKMENNKFVPVEGKTVWWLNKYHVVTDFSKFKYKE